MKTLSLESSKRLHELGVVVESKCWWINDELFLFDIEREYAFHFITGERVGELCVGQLGRDPTPAPTFEELWAVLPVKIDTKEHGECWLNMWWEEYSDGSKGPRWGYADHKLKAYGEHESPTEAAGMLLVWLAENGHVEAN